MSAMLSCQSSKRYRAKRIDQYSREIGRVDEFGAHEGAFYPLYFTWNPNSMEHGK